MVESTAGSNALNLAKELERIQSDEVVEKTVKFLGPAAPLQVRVTTAQQTVNMNDHKDVALVFDMRSAKQFAAVSLDKSVNLPPERFTEDTFINWPKHVPQLEADTSVLPTKWNQHAFKRRRRHWIFIIPCQSSANLDAWLLELSNFGSKKALAGLVATATTDQQREDLLSLRNALLLVKALKAERIREMDLCIDGFDKFQKYYYHFLQDENRKMFVPKPELADCYPNEIFPGRLYLGDWHHAKDTHCIETLKITHILNISDTCENYLAASHPHIKYLHHCLHDNKEQQINHVFHDIYDFIKQSTMPDGGSTGSKEGLTSDLLPAKSEEYRKPKRELPVSNQVIDVDFKANTTLVSAGKQQSEYVRIQKQFRDFNRANTDVKSKCLVHCAMGMSRSATSVIMFIMRLFSMKLDDAFEYVKTQREATDPNDGFMEQLRMFEEKAFKFESELDQDSPSPTTKTVMRFSKFEEELAHTKHHLEGPSTPPRTPRLAAQGSAGAGGALKLALRPAAADFDEPEVKTFNFATGPSVLPKDVLRTAQAELLDWQGRGVSVMEMNTRSPHFQQIARHVRDGLRKLLAIPDNFTVLFFPGDQSLQSSAVCYNLLGEGSNGSSNCLTTGTWSERAFAEAQKFGDANAVTTSNWSIKQDAALFHYVDNEQDQGFQFNDFPFEKVPAGSTLVCDMTATITTKKIDWSKYGVVYAGVQDQIGPAGLVITIVRNDLVGKHRKDTPAMLEWEAQATAPNGLSATLPCWQVYMCGLHVDHMLSLGGVNELGARTRARADLMYRCLDESKGYYVNTVQPQYRSKVDIPFSVGQSEELETKFLKEAAEINLLELKDHTNTVGCRASLYNAMSFEGAYALIHFMKQFMHDNPKA